MSRPSDPQRMADASHLFSSSYDQARERFRSAARARSAQLESFGIDACGAHGEALTTDVAVLPSPTGNRLLIVSSATHGVEGFCGSACQLALLDDDALLERAADAGVTLLLVHAINPYGFSWQSRTNEDNVDLNRNAHGIDTPRPDNPDYAALHPLLIPPTWPPNAADRRALADYIEHHGPTRFRDAVSRGQYSHPNGLFYGGTQRSASLRTLEHVLRAHGGHRTDIGWIDVHTGLGPFGHGEKIFAGRRDVGEVARARQWWGQDLAVPFEGTSASADITGHLATLIYTACPHARCTSMALEFGTVPFEAMVDALRGEAWLRAHPDAPGALARSIRQALRDAFCSDDPLWRGMVLGQCRTALLQALGGLGAGAPARPRSGASLSEPRPTKETS